MSEKCEEPERRCEELRQRCKEAKEELFKHLAAIESTGGVTAQLSTTALFAAVSIVAALIGTIFSAITVGVSVHTLIRQDPQAMALLVLLPYSAIVFMLSYLFLWVRREEKTHQRAIGVVGKVIEYHKKRLKALAEKLSNCCTRLSESECDYYLETLCSDSEDLKSIVGT